MVFVFSHVMVVLLLHGMVVVFLTCHGGCLLHVMVVVFYMSYDTISFVCGMAKSFHMSWCFFFSCHVVLAFLVFYFRVFGSTCELLQSIYTYEGLRDEFFQCQIVKRMLQQHMQVVEDLAAKADQKDLTAKAGPTAE